MPRACCWVLYPRGVCVFLCLYQHFNLSATIQSVPQIQGITINCHLKHISQHSYITSANHSWDVSKCLQNIPLCSYKRLFLLLFLFSTSTILIRKWSTFLCTEYNFLLNERITQLAILELVPVTETYVIKGFKDIMTYDMFHLCSFKLFNVYFCFWFQKRTMLLEWIPEKSACLLWCKIEGYIFSNVFPLGFA